MALEICFPEKCLTTCFLHALTTFPVCMPTSLKCGSVHINVMYTCIYIYVYDTSILPGYILYVIQQAKTRLFHHLTFAINPLLSNFIGKQIFFMYRYIDILVLNYS